MVAKSKHTAAQELNAAQLAICNSLADGEILGLVGSFGYSQARLTEGNMLYDKALAAVNGQRAKAGEQQNATNTLLKAEFTARDGYQALAKVARAVFIKDKAQLAALGLGGKTPKDTAGFIAAARTLFDNAAGLPVLANFGYDAARLQSERLKISAYEAANQQQEAAKGAAQQSTREQEEALSALNLWVAQYLKIARVALRGKPQLLEKIGVTARSSKTAAQRAAPLKAAATRQAKKTK